MVCMTDMLLRLILGLCCIGYDQATSTGVINAADGLRIAYTSEGQGKPAIVFIHGWTCDRSHWRFQLADLRTSYRVIAIDLPGHGESGANRDAWSIDGLGADVATVVRGLELDDVVLVGHSMGAPVALSAAPRLSGVVRGIIAVDALHNVEFKGSPAAAQRMITRFTDDFDGARTRFMTGFFTDKDSPTLKWILEKTVKPERTAALGLLVDYHRFDFKAALSAAGVPVWAINAAGPYPTAVHINQKYAVFAADTMSGVGHFLMLEKADAMNRLLRNALDTFPEN